VSAIAIGYSDEATESSGALAYSFDAPAIPEGADPLIVLLDSCADVNDSVLGRRKLELNRALEDGARLVLTIGPGIAATQNAKFVTWLMGKLGFATAPREGLEIRSEVPELRAYFSGQLCHATIGDHPGPGDVPRAGEVLGTAVNADGSLVGTAASRWMHGETEVIALPHWMPGPTGALETVLAAVQAIPPRAEYPMYLDDFVLGNEAELREELMSVNARATEITDQLGVLRRSKGILYMTGIELEQEAARLLTELGIPTRHVRGNREDLQLVDAGSDEVWGIGEVKAAEKRTIERTELSKVDLHRKEAGHPSDFPALLVASTYRARQSIAARDEPMPPNIVRRAAEDHILIVRALDLIRLKQIALSGTEAASELADAVRERGGWFEVRPDFSINVHEE